VGEQEKKIRRPFGQTAHIPSEPIISVRNEHADAPAVAGQPHLLAALNPIEHVKGESLFPQSTLARKNLDAANQFQIVGNSGTDGTFPIVFA
jgi:hypothetical protein